MRLMERQLQLCWLCHAEWPAESMKMTGVLVEEGDPKDLTTTPEASMDYVEGMTRPRIRGRQLRLWSCDDRPEELSTTTEASEEKNDPEELRMKKKALSEEAEETTLPSECLQRRRWQYVYGPREFTTTTSESEEEDGSEYSATTTEASAEDEELMTRPRDWRR